MQLLREQVIAGSVIAVLIAFSLLMADEHDLSRCFEYSLFKTRGQSSMAATVNHVDWSADGKTLMIAARHWDSAASRLSVHQLAGQGYIPSWSEMLRDSLNHATLSPDAKTVVAGTCTGELWWIDLETTAATELVKLDGLSPFISTAISDDGRLMAGGTEGGKIYICNPTRGTAKLLPQSVTDPIRRLHFSDDNRKLLCVRTNGSIGVWDAESAELLGEEESNRQVENAAAAFLPDAHRVISMADGGGLKIWDIASKTEHWRGAQGTYGSHGVAALDVTADGTVAAWGDGLTRRIVIWDLDNQRMKYEIENPSMIVNLQFSPDGKSLAVAGLEPIVRVYDVSTGKETHRIDVQQIHETRVRT